MEDNLQNIDSISEIQDAFKEKLLENVWFSNHSIPILVENAKDIEFEIKTTMSSLGICITVSTPSLSYQGELHSEEPFWNIEGGSIIVVENPTLNRGKANYATALDTALQVAETIKLIESAIPTSILQSTQNGLVVVEVAFKTNIGFRYEKTEKTKTL